MKFNILTQFPEMFLGIINSSILLKAQEKNILSFNLINIRDFTQDKHKRTDDTPFGGGAGMVMCPQPAFDALDSINAKDKKVIYMSPRGRVLSKELALEYINYDELVIVCGHYEGIDQRIIDNYSMDEISIGDYVLTGGELPCMVFIDVLSRLIPGVLKNEESSLDESIYSGLLEADMYTKPREYNGLTVPDILFSGDHEKIKLWKYENSLNITKKKRRDIFSKYLKDVDLNNLTKNEKTILNKVKRED